ncbi:hypothetical protein Y032_0192g1345 [Ancylostoma ceylanicum]|uniref:Uncharacterized protein n=1 Tax=Ancylostoma ceylanicum TaxID=53326 RepID=A0A016SPQ9_9BILA|nr:hypothetical protein Y032_0192g1345 [Ancylostoma ceylanicum]
MPTSAQPGGFGLQCCKIRPPVRTNVLHSFFHHCARWIPKLPPHVLLSPNTNVCKARLRKLELLDVLKSSDY